MLTLVFTISPFYFIACRWRALIISVFVVISANVWSSPATRQLCWSRNIWHIFFKSKNIWILMFWIGFYCFSLVLLVVYVNLSCVASYFVFKFWIISSIAIVMFYIYWQSIPEVVGLCQVHEITVFLSKVSWSCFPNYVWFYIPEMMSHVFVTKWVLRFMIKLNYSLSFRDGPYLRY